MKITRKASQFLIAGAIILSSTTLSAKSTLDPAPFHKKLSQIAGKAGAFNPGKEQFPKDYFLVPRNLPFLVGLSLLHPQSSTLNLTEEQIKKIMTIKKTTVPMIVKAVKDVKMLEAKLAENIAMKSETPESQYELVDAISKTRTQLTKEHLKCIHSVRSILTKEQYLKLLEYAIADKEEREHAQKIVKETK